MKRLVAYLADGINNRNEAEFLKKLLALFMIFKCAYWFYDIDMLFSENSIAYHNTVRPEWWKMPVFILYDVHSVFLAVTVLSVAILASLLIIRKGTHTRLLFFILWIIISNINNRVFCTLTGGDLLFQHLLFFAAFLSGKGAEEGGVSNIVHNTGVLAIQLQMCVLYFMAGYTKIIDPDWIGGNAVADVFKIRDYNLPIFYDFGNYAITRFLNYMVMFYQLLFPVLVWIGKIRKGYLFLGMAQHLFIAFAFGLPSFGFIMVISYSIFHCPSYFKKYVY